MSKLSSRQLLITRTLQTNQPPQTTHLEAYNRYKETLQNKKEALNRVRVLARQLQKSRSDLRNKRIHKDQVRYSQQMANLDRYILTLNANDEEKSLKKLHDVNIKKRKQRMKHMSQVKSQLQSTNTSIFRSTERKRIDHQRSIIVENQKLQTEREIEAMRQRIREKKRNSNVLDYYQMKMRSIRGSKDKDMKKLEAEQNRKSQQIESIINKNARLRLKKQRSQKGAFLFQTFLDLSSTQALNPQRQIKPRKSPKVRLIKQMIHV